MTQMMLDFGFSANIYVPSEGSHRVTNHVAEPKADLTVAKATTSNSLPLYDSQRSELKQIGDLAQLVLARYDIVRRRREARLQRQAQRK